MWYRYRSEYNFDIDPDGVWPDIVTAMAEEIREKVRDIFNPVSNRIFLDKYLTMDPEFRYLLEYWYGFEYLD